MISWVKIKLVPKVLYDKKKTLFAVQLRHKIIKKNFLKANMYFFIECNRKISDAGKVLMSYVNTKGLNKNKMFCLEE